MERRQSERRPAGALEAEVLAALWAADGPLTPAEVLADIDTELAYTTVMTALSRLLEKRVVSRRRAGRAYAYTPVLDRPGIAAARMRELLDTGEDRRAVMARFVGSLNEAEERELQDALREVEAEEADHR